MWGNYIVPFRFGCLNFLLPINFFFAMLNLVVNTMEQHKNRTKKDYAKLLLKKIPEVRII